MATFHGHLPEYDGNTEDWTVYIERLKHYFIANDIKSDKKQRSLLLSVCGVSTFKLIQSLLPGDKLGGKKFAEIATLIQEHFHPQPSEIVSRFNFNSSVRLHGKSVLVSFVYLSLPTAPAYAWKSTQEPRCLLSVKPHTGGCGQRMRPS